MARKVEPEWTKFKIGANRAVLATISHVAHLDTALRIVADGKLRAGLVFDKSKLNDKRILVNWLSPNDWWGAGGFRYGNVRFTFDWKALVRNKKYYWVESIAYGIAACRILVTSNNYTRELESYNPTGGDGPWWYDVTNDRHYWNGDYCLEIMLEQDLVVGDSQSTDFVDHHRERCSVDPRSCASRGVQAYQASALFVSALVAQGIDPKALKLTQNKSGRVVVAPPLRMAWDQLYRALSNLETNFTGGITTRHHVALPLARSIYNAYAQSRQTDLSKLADLFSNRDVMLESCARAIAEHFRIDDWSTFNSDE